MYSKSLQRICMSYFVFWFVLITLYVQERLQACLANVQYLSDESEKADDKVSPREEEGTKTATETPDVILVEDDSDTNDIPPKKRARSKSDSRERQHKKVLKTERRVVVDMTRDRKIREQHKDKRRDFDRKRDEKVRPREEGKREEIRKDDRPSRRTNERQKEDVRKDESSNRKPDEDQQKRKDVTKRDEMRKRELDKR